MNGGTTREASTTTLAQSEPTIEELLLDTFYILLFETIIFQMSQTLSGL